MSDDLRHLPGCVENPRTEAYTAAGYRLARCIDCGAQAVGGPAPAEVAAVLDPERNPRHPCAGVTMRGLTYTDLERRAYGSVVDMTPTEDR